VIKDAIARNASSLTVKYDPKLGYPTQINIDYDQQMADEELYLTIEKLYQVRLIAYDMMLRCWALGIRHWKIISILITNYPLPITNYRAVSCAGAFTFSFALSGAFVLVLEGGSQPAAPITRIPPSKNGMSFFICLSQLKIFAVI
jgi:hypothetical protein